MIFGRIFIALVTIYLLYLLVIWALKRWNQLIIEERKESIENLEATAKEIEQFQKNHKDSDSARRKVRDFTKD